jgi:hypothetical protein
MAKGRQELTPAACICASICRFVGDQNSLLSATTQVTSLEPNRTERLSLGVFLSVPSVATARDRFCLHIFSKNRLGVCF